MNKYLLLTLNILLLSGFTSLAQSPKKKNKIAKKAAQETCDCFNDVMSSFHPEVVKLMQNMVEKGEEKAIQEFTAYMMGLSQDEQNKFMQEMERLSKMESLLKDNCSEVEKKYAQYKKDDEFSKQVEYHLRQSESCKLLAEILKKAEQDTKEEGSEEN